MRSTLLHAADVSLHCTFAKTCRTLRTRIRPACFRPVFCRYPACITNTRSASRLNTCSEAEVVPEGDDDGGGLRAGSDERDDEEEDEEGDEGVAGAVALPRHGVAVLVQVGLDDDELQLVAALAAGRRRYDLPALDAGALRVVTDLRGGTTVQPHSSTPCFQPSEETVG